jgi:dihydroneopterin aldolase
MSDRIFLRGLSAKCIIGFIDWERRTPQTLQIDLEMPCDCARAARSDRVEDTVDYKRVAKRVLGWLPTTQFQLVETLAHHLALLLISEFELEWIRVSLNKPGAIRDSRDVGVQIERQRADLSGWQLPSPAAAVADAAAVTDVVAVPAASARE